VRKGKKGRFALQLPAEPGSERVRGLILFRGEKRKKGKGTSQYLAPFGGERKPTDLRSYTEKEKKERGEKTAPFSLLVREKVRKKSPSSACLAIGLDLREKPEPAGPPRQNSTRERRRTATIFFFDWEGKGGKKKTATLSRLCQRGEGGKA